MDFDTYQQLARRTINGSQSERDNLLNWGLGVAGEAGEIADVVKKHCFHGHELDTQVVAKEVGDVLWYLSALADWIGVPLAKIAQMNADKLRKRYPNGFTPHDSLNRVEYEGSGRG